MTLRPGGASSRSLPLLRLTAERYFASYLIGSPDFRRCNVCRCLVRRTAMASTTMFVRAG